MKYLSLLYTFFIISSSLLEADINNTFMMNVEEQFNAESNKKGAAFAFSKIDTSTPETKALMDSIWEGNFFGLTPYHDSYFLPFSMANSKYPRISENQNPNAPLTPLEEKYKNYGKLETEFQISFKKQISYNFFGWNEFIFAAYTQTVFWQLYQKSAPFRETNYKPEIYLSIPSSTYFDENFGLKAVRYGFLHDSNGQDGYRSRSWNRLYIKWLWQWKNLFLASKVWYRLPEKQKSYAYYHGNGFEADGLPTDPHQEGDDNPHIEHYFGYGDLNFHYLYGKSQFSSIVRYNFGVGGTQRGAVEFNWSYPFLYSKNMFWYTKIFSGYGESLIDYDRSVTKASFGFSFSRALF